MCNIINEDEDEEKHFGRGVSGNLKCDVLAGEQGPSCHTLEQVPNINKLIHVRFIIENDDPEPEEATTEDNDDVQFISTSITMGLKRKNRSTKSSEATPTVFKSQPGKSRCYYICTLLCSPTACPGHQALAPLPPLLLAQ